jgi:hypothetical protein
MKKTGKLPLNLAGGRTTNRQQYGARITLDGLATKVDVLSGDKMLGLDIFSRYDSTWDFSTPAHAVDVTARQGEQDDSDLST